MMLDERWMEVRPGFWHSGKPCHRHVEQQRDQLTHDSDGRQLPRRNGSRVLGPATGRMAECLAE